MTERAGDKVDLYLFRLEKALGLPPERAAAVVEEVRAGLEAQVERETAGGRSEEEAVERALEDLGPAEDLAANMSGELPPFAGRGLTVLRYVVAGGLMAWTALLFWTLRAWTFGPDPLVTGLVVCLHLPAILVTWPRIVWRKNWLFGLIPAGVLVAGVLIAVNAGTQSEMEIGPIGLTDGEAMPTLPPTNPEPPRWPALLVSGTMGAVCAYLLLAMQQRAQRVRVSLIVVTTLVLLELPFLLEESSFRRDRDRVAAYLEGESPGDGPLDALELGLANTRASIRLDDGDFTLFWSRPLNRGFAIVYSSADDSIRVND